MNEARIGFNRATFVSDYNDWAGIGNANAKLGIAGSQAIPGLSSIRIGQGLTDVGTAFTNERNYTNRFIMEITCRLSWKAFLKWRSMAALSQNRYYPAITDC